MNNSVSLANALKFLFILTILSFSSQDACIASNSKLSERSDNAVRDNSRFFGAATEFIWLHDQIPQKSFKLFCTAVGIDTFVLDDMEIGTNNIEVKLEIWGSKPHNIYPGPTGLHVYWFKFKNETIETGTYQKSMCHYDLTLDEWMVVARIIFFNYFNKDILSSVLNVNGSGYINMKPPITIEEFEQVFDDCLYPGSFKECAKFSKFLAPTRELGEILRYGKTEGSKNIVLGLVKTTQLYEDIFEYVDIGAIEEKFGIMLFIQESIVVIPIRTTHTIIPPIR